jgi:hypothetical protein
MLIAIDERFLIGNNGRLILCFCFSQHPLCVSVLISTGIVYNNVYFFLEKLCVTHFFRCMIK